MIKPLVRPLVRPLVTGLFGACRQVLTLNGTSQLITAPRITGIDMDNLDVELEGYFDLTGTGTLWSQSISSNAANREFQVFTNSSDGITVILGGSSTKITLGASVKQDTALWAVRLNGTAVTIFKDGSQVGSGTASIGASREPTATFKIGARGDGTDTTYGFFLGGQLKNQKVWTGGSRTTGTLDLDMLVNDGFVNDPVIVNSVGANGTVVNATSGSWSEVCS